MKRAKVGRVKVFQEPRRLAAMGAKKCPWSIEWSEGGRRQQKMIGTKKDAEKAAAVIAGRLVSDPTGAILPRRVKWCDFVAEYQEKVVSTMRSERSQQAITSVLGVFGRIAKPTYLSDVTASLLDGYVATRLQQRGCKPGSVLSAVTIGNHIRVVGAALHRAADWGYIGRVPRLPKVNTVTRDKRFVRESDWLAMLRLLDEHPEVVIHPSMPDQPYSPADFWRALLLFLWTTPLRRTALLRLRWSDVDLDSGWLTSKPNDNKGKRPLRAYLPSIVCDALRAIRGHKVDGPVFDWPGCVGCFMDTYHAIQKAAGIDLPCPEADQHDCTDACHVYCIHDFRRSHATYNWGRVSDKALTGQMGHTSLRTTAMYRKFAEDHQDGAVNVYIPASITEAVETAEKMRRNLA